MKKKKNNLEPWKLFIDSIKNFKGIFGVPEIFKEFLRTFRFKSNFLYILFYDLLFYGVIVPLFSLFSFLMNKKMVAVDPSILSNFNPSSLTNVTAAQTQQMQLALQSLQGFMYTLIIGIILLIIIGLLVFTLTRTLIWNHLLKKKFDIKKYLKFNLLNLLLALLAVILYVIIRIIAPFIINPLIRISFNFALFVSATLFLLIFIAVIYFVSLVFFNYTKKEEVFGSISKTFKLIKTIFHKIYISYLFILIYSFSLSQ